MANWVKSRAENRICNLCFSKIKFKDIDKFKDFNITSAKGSQVKAPIIQGSFSHMECKVVTSYSTGNYSIYLAEVVAFDVNDELTPIAWFHNKYFSLREESAAS